MDPSTSASSPGRWPPSPRARLRRPMGTSPSSSISPGRRPPSRYTMNGCYELLRPSFLVVPSGQKKPQRVLFNTDSRSFLVASTAQQTHSVKPDKLRAGLDDNVKPWFRLFGMSLADAYNGFPESVRDMYGDTRETPKKKDMDKNQSGWSTDTDFDSRFAESVVLDRALYKYGILGCKNNVHKIMNEGLISACDRDKIIHCLATIEDGIELEKFEWIDGVDVHTNIVEALADKLGDLPKDLATCGKYDSCLMILEIWCKNCIDQIIEQIKQVALVLLAIRNEGLVLPGNREFKDNVSIESLVLPIIKAVNFYLPDT